MTSSSPPSATGRLATMPLHELLVYALDKRLDGEFTLADPEQDVNRVLFRSGAPVAVRGPVAPPLGEVLLRSRAIDAATQLRTAPLANDESAFAEALLSTGIIRLSQLASAKREQTSQALRALLVRAPGETVFEYAVASDTPDGFAVDPLPLVIVGLAEHGLDSRARSRLDAIAEIPLEVHPDAPLDRLGLSSGELGALASLRGRGLTLSRILDEPSLSTERWELLAYLLLVTRSFALPTLTRPPVDAAGEHRPRVSIMPSRAPASAPTAAPLVEPVPASRATPLRALLFAFALVPLALSTFIQGESIEDRLAETARRNTALEPILTDPHATVEQLFAAMPEGKIVGAHLAYGSLVHWLYALLAAAAFFAAITLLFPPGPTSRAPRSMLLANGVFTATVGIGVLLLFLWIAEATQSVRLMGGSIVVVFFWIVKLIGYSYRAASDPENGFLASFVGFTAGVGLCEEIVKAIPALWHFRRTATLDARGACALGLASGAGFGIAEGIHYASEFYNGLSTWQVYVVRFVSCVAVHACWSAIVAITIEQNQAVVQGYRRWYEWLFAVVRLAWGPMILHGLYDTLLKRDMPIAAFGVAVASFLWLGWAIHRATRYDGLEMDSAFSDPTRR